MKNFTNLIEVTKLIDENLVKLKTLHEEKERLLILYNKDKTILIDTKKRGVAIDL